MSEIDLEMLVGKWYINLTNFPMWLKGDKTEPTFNYSIENKNDITVLKDEVIYQKNGKSKSIIGFDIPKNTTNRSFIWRGKGILSLLTSKWKILYLDSDENWAIIHFEKTLFTPEGYDVISRKKVLEQNILNKINKKLSELGIKENLKIL